MSVNLVKGQRISLEKEAGGSLSKVFMGLGWDVAKKGGFLGKLVGGGSIDLDASCLLFDKNRQLVDIVYFGHLASNDGSIRHSGDNLTGEGEGDDEVINVDLDKVAPNVEYLVFTVCSYRGQTFNQVENAFCRLVDASGGKEIAKFVITGGGDYTAMLMAKLYRHNGEWKMHALGDHANAKTANDLVGPAVAAL